GQVAGEIAEEREWLLRTPFLAHVEHGWHRQQQRDRQRGLDGGGGCQRLETVSERAVSDLVVVLEEVDESNRWQVCTVLPARQGAAMRRRLALIGKAAAQTAQQMPPRRIGIVAVIARLFPGQQDMPGVVVIVVRLRAIPPCPGIATRSEQPRGIVVILEH